MTLLAFIYFARSEVDCAVVEVGLGGRLDSTNIVLPAVSVITSIGLDHIQILGGTIADIAREKAGIIKESVPAVCGWLPPEAIAVVQGACGEKHSRLYQAADFFPSDGELPETSLYGYYQRRNAAVALQTVRVLRKLAKEGKAPELFDISDESAKKPYLMFLGLLVGKQSLCRTARGLFWILRTTRRAPRRLIQIFQNYPPSLRAKVKSFR